MSSKVQNIHCDELLTVVPVPHLHVGKSAPLRTAVDRILCSLIVEKDRERFRLRAHKCNSCANENGDAEHIESVLHEDKGRRGVQCQAKRQKASGEEEEKWVKGRVNSGKKRTRMQLLEHTWEESSLICM